MYRKSVFMPDRTYLEDAYKTRNMTYADIAKERGVTPSAVWYWCKKYGIEPRKNGVQVHPHIITDEDRERTRRIHTGKVVSTETRQKISQSHKLHGQGHAKLRDDGYVKVYYPEHPNASKDGYVMQHRLVMEGYIGRLLKPEEVVHHVNHNRLDNRVENLRLMTIQEHAALHMKERRKTR